VAKWVGIHHCIKQIGNNKDQYQVATKKTYSIALYSCYFLNYSAFMHTNITVIKFSFGHFYTEGQFNYICMNKCTVSTSTCSISTMLAIGFLGRNLVSVLVITNLFMQWWILTHSAVTCYQFLFLQIVLFCYYFAWQCIFYSLKA